MSKKTKLIVSLILSVIVLIYIVLEYYGIIRYYKLHWFSTEKYVKSYSSLEKADKNKVVLTFSCPVEKLKNLKPFINSLLDQTVKVDEIALTIPFKNVDKIPAYLSEILTVDGYSKDYGDKSCMICPILRETEANTKIIIVDPDMVYSKEFVQDMVDESNKNPDKIVYGKGKDPKFGILIKPGFFDGKDDCVSCSGKKDCIDWLNSYCKATAVCAGCTGIYSR